MKAWIGVDLDGTLAHSHNDGAIGSIGEPIHSMVERVIGWIKENIEVRIVTARVSSNLPPEERQAATDAIREWCWTHIGHYLVVTSEKDYGMLELWDDRAISIEHNTGKVLTARRQWN